MNYIATQEKDISSYIMLNANVNIAYPILSLDILKLSILKMIHKY
jgi:hypothetical protein